MIQFQLQQFTVKYSNSFSEVEDLWTKNSTSESLSKENLSAIENSKIGDVTPYYLLIYKENNLAGLIYYQMLHFNSAFIDLGILNKWYYSLLQFFIRRIKTNLLICGNLFRIGFKGFEGISSDDAAFITKRIAEDSLFGMKICGILLKDLDHTLGLKTASKHGYKPMNSDVTMEMLVRENWNSFEDYISDLKRKYKKRAKGILKKKEGLEIRLLSLEEIKQHQDQLNTLYQNIVSKQIVRLGVLNGNYFYELKKLLLDTYQIFGFFTEGKLIAFTSHIYYEKQMEINYIGFDYKLNDKYALYFNILFHGLETAIDKKLSKVELGRTAKEAKASMGAEPEANINYYCINNPFLNTLFNKIRKNFTKKMGDNWANRQPLK